MKSSNHLAWGRAFRYKTITIMGVAPETTKKGSWEDLEVPAEVATATVVAEVDETPVSEVQE